METRQKMVKKSKNAMLEMPEYFTHDELMKEFGLIKNSRMNNT
jgi:hypothetical protein